jgi:predicted NACHT family NTPase
MMMMARYAAKNCWGFRHLTDFFIPHRLTPQSSDLLSQSMIQAKESTGSLEIEDVLAAMPTDEAARRLAIIGPPGSGKTALLKYLQQIYREHRHQQLHSGMPNLMPTILCLPDIRSMILADRPPSLLSLMAWGEPPETRQRLEHHLQQGDYLVMVDGLDEIDGGSSDDGNSNDGNCGQSDRSRIVYWLDRQMQIYPNTPFIVTSREIADRLTPLPQVRMVLELQPFNDRQIQQFLQHWYRLNYASREIDSPNQTDLTVQLLAEIKSNRSIAEMATNPLLLKAIALIYEDRGKIPTRRVELYETLSDILLTDKSANPADRDRNLPILKSQLQKLALGLMKQKASQFTADSLSQIFPAENLQLFPNLDRFGGLVVEVRAGVYEFAHQSWQAYLAAVEINDSEQAGLLVENIQNHWWHETIKFYTAIAENTQVIHAALSAATTLNLAYDCLQNYFIKVPSSLLSAFNQKLAAGLEADNPIIFQSAAKVRLKQRCQKLLDSE